MIRVEQVSQCFRSGFWLKKTPVLHEVSFSIREQSVFGLLGANGAGKTTLMLLMAGMRRPTRGKITIGGHDAASLEAKQKIGYLPERPYFHPHLTGYEFLKFVGQLSGMSRSALLARIEQVLEKVGLIHARNKELRFFSKGMLQRIGLGQAILHNPEVLILDEPMSGLDPVGRKEMRELISHLSREGKTVVFSSHVISDVEALCDEIVFLQQGKMLKSGSTSEFLRSEQGGQMVDFSLDARQLPLLGQWKNFGDFEEIPEGFRAYLRSQEDLNSMLRVLMDARAQILRVQPVRRSLEEALFEEMNA